MFLTPAPQRTGVSLTLITFSIVLVITSGLAVLTDISPPISSGGSIAIKSGLKCAIDYIIRTKKVAITHYSN